MFMKCLLVLFFIFFSFEHAESSCVRSQRILAAEEICWSSTVKITDRIQYHTKNFFNFAKEKLGIGTEDEAFYPQQCEYYTCIFGDLKMLDSKGYPNELKIIQWIDNNVIYNYAKVQYDKIKECYGALSESISSNTYFSGDLNPQEDELSIQSPCEVSKEFMKCISSNNITQCIIFTYP